MGVIAEAGQYKLFRAIMRASSALPGLFPPVELSYDDGTTEYRETHIDGGVQMQFLAIPDYAFTTPGMSLAGGHIYLMVNNTLNPAPTEVSRSALGISQQAMTTMIRANARAAVHSTQLYAYQNGLGFSVASVDPDSGIVYDPSDRFSSDYMNGLYRHGYGRAVQGQLWSDG